MVKCTSLCASLPSRPLQHKLFAQTVVDHGDCKAGSNIHRLVRVTARNGLVLRDRPLDGSALIILVRHRMADLGCEIGPQYAPEPTGPIQSADRSPAAWMRPLSFQQTQQRRERKAPMIPIRNEAVAGRHSRGRRSVAQFSSPRRIFDKANVRGEENKRKSVRNKTTRNGRHVGLDFRDLLIEGRFTAT